MSQLMISLDKKILDKSSAVARRMIDCGQKQELFILIPDKNKINLDLSSSINIQSTGGVKFLQFFNLVILGRKLLKNHTIKEITTQDPFFTGLAGVILKFFTSKKLEVQLHGDFFSGDYYKKSGLGNFIKYYLGKFVLLRTNTIRVVGERIKNSLLKFGIEEDKIIVRPVKMDMEAIKIYQSKLNLHEKYPDYEKIFLLLGRFDPVKNILWLVNVFAEIVKEHQKYLLLIVGGGAERKNIENLIKEKHLENNIVIEDWTNDPVGYLKSADCLLFPSLSEGYGLVSMEASTVGLPVIMSDVGVAGYELEPSDKVKILPINDKEQWVQAILNI